MQKIGSELKKDISKTRAQIIENYVDLSNRLDGIRSGKKVVCTIGSWDILHRGHIEYLRRASEQGDMLVVGVDSDLAYQRYKNKPVMYPQSDREEIVASISDVDFVTIVNDVDLSGKWQMDLIKAIRPDVFVCNEVSYSPDQIKNIKDLCQVQLLPFYKPSAIVDSALISEELKSLYLTQERRRVQMRVLAFWLIMALFALTILVALTLISLESFHIVEINPFTFTGTGVLGLGELYFGFRLGMKYVFTDILKDKY